MSKVVGVVFCGGGVHRWLHWWLSAGERLEEAEQVYRGGRIAEWLCCAVGGWDVFLQGSVCVVYVCTARLTLYSYRFSTNTQQP